MNRVSIKPEAVHILERLECINRCGEMAMTPSQRFGQDTQVHDDAAEAEEWAQDAIIPKYSTNTYGADYPVEALVRRLTLNHRDETATIHLPSFQRGYVWTTPQADRFIESLLLGLPVPGIFLWKDPDSQRLAVIDGSQRLRTLKFFYDGVIRSREFSLDRVHPDFAGCTYNTLSDPDRRRLDDSIIHASVVRQDEPEGEHSSIFYIVQRINTGGSPAQPQEIRNAIYQGALADLLLELDQYEPWRKIYGPRSNRLKDQELVLRFFALLYDSHHYKSPMKDFLNAFMRMNQKPTPAKLRQYRSAFTRTIDLVFAALGGRAFRTERSLNAAVFDAVMVGLAKRLEAYPTANPDSLATAYKKLLRGASFRDSTTTGTSQDQNVATRLRVATESFQRLR